MSKSIIYDEKIIIKTSTCLLHLYFMRNFYNYQAQRMHFVIIINIFGDNFYNTLVKRSRYSYIESLFVLINIFHV